eukprot:6471693-Amphidinium_carterae.1
MKKLKLETRSGELPDTSPLARACAPCRPPSRRISVSAKADCGGRRCKRESTSGYRRGSVQKLYDTEPGGACQVSDLIT